MAKNKLIKKQLQEYACLWMSHIGFNETEISDKLDTDIDTIILWVRQNKLKSQNKQSLFINHTSSKKSNSVSIMTREASERSDSSKKNTVSQNSRSNEKNIFRPNG